MNDFKTEFIAFGTKSNIRKLGNCSLNVDDTSSSIEKADQVKGLGGWLYDTTSIKCNVQQKCKISTKFKVFASTLM